MSPPQPLKLKNPRKMLPGTAEKVCMLLPFIGWSIGYFCFQKQRLDRAWGEVRAQLLIRNGFPEESWGSEPGRLSLAQDVSQMIQKACDWPNDYYLPEDPWCLLTVDREDFAFFEIMYQVEKMLEIDTALAPLLEDPNYYLNATLADVVDAALAASTTSFGSR